MRKENNLSIKLSTINYKLSTKGLTLIEIMVVVAIMVIISSGLFSIFQGSLNSQRRGTNKALVYSEARAALDMMSRDIEKAFVDERKGIKCVGYGNEPAIKIKGGDSIAEEFFFVAPINPDNNSDEKYRGDLCEVGYWLKNTADIKNTLMRHYTSESTDFDFTTFTAANDNQLVGNVSNLQFEYFDGTNWSSLWHYTSSPYEKEYLPQAVKITLTMKYEMEKDVEREQDFTTVVYIPGSGQ